MNNKLSTLYILSILSLLGSTLALANDNLSIKLGGSSDRSTTMFTSNVSYSNKTGLSPYSQYMDFDSIYKNSNNRTTTDLYDVYGKINYNLPYDNKNYLQTSIRLQHNPGSHYHDIVVVGIGHGYRVIHTDTVKVSIESSIAQAKSIDDGDDITGLDQTILRESIWASYSLGHKSSISDKLLVERGGPIDYIKNILSIEYKIDHDIYISLSHTWIRDEVNQGLINVTSVNLGFKF